MKVLFIASDNSPASGAFLSMVTLCALLRDMYRVEVKAVLPLEGEGYRLLEEKNIPFVRLNYYSWVVDQRDLKDRVKITARALRNRVVNGKAVARIVKLIKEEGFKLVHLNTTYAQAGAQAALRAGVPFVWHLRELLEEDQGRSIDQKERGYALIGRADKIIAISSAVYDKYRALLPPDKLVKILNGIDTARFWRPEKTVMERPDSFILLYGGGYARQKGIYELGSALQYLKSIGIENFRLWLIGDAPEKYRAFLHKSGLDGNIRYLGYQKDVERWYSQADMAFSCSKMEAFGRKTVEAMLCGCLMIAADTGGSLDIVQHGKTGLLYRQGDPLSLAYTVLYAMNHREEAQKMAAAGRAYAYEHFSATENAEKVYQVYREILG